MADLTNYLESALLNHVFRNVALTSPTTVYVALFTSAPTESGGGTEVSGNGYSRIAVTFDAPINDPDDTTRQAILNDTEILFQSTHDPVVSVVATGLYDAATGGNLLAFQTITTADLGVGKDIRFSAGKLKVYMA